MPSFLNDLLRSPSGHFLLINTRTQRVVASTILTAFDSASRRKGLLGRDGLSPGTALIIAPSNAIHTFFMRFPIDVAFVAKDGRVVKVRTGVGPWRMSAAFRAFAVVELPTGTLERSATAAGDRLSVAAG